MAAKANAKHRQDCGGKGGMDGAGDSKSMRKAGLGVRVYHTKYKLKNEEKASSSFSSDGVVVKVGLIYFSCRADGREGGQEEVAESFSFLPFSKTRPVETQHKGLGR